MSLPERRFQCVHSLLHTTAVAAWMFVIGDLQQREQYFDVFKF
jgi:hypothetical protein